MRVAPTPPETTACDREQIHSPGSIQPHGMMVVATVDGLLVRHVAGQVERRLNVERCVDRPLQALIGDILTLKVQALIDREGPGGFIGQLRVAAGEVLDVTALVSGTHVILELEAASVEGLTASEVTDILAMASAGFERAASLTALCDRAAIEVRRLTGFDRVMVYHFRGDASGVVVAEDRRKDVGTFLHNHFPATDIPVQARALYVQNVLRVIPDVGYTPIALRPAWTEATQLDMTHSSLRSVSPIHLEYLRNMGVQASASFSIISEEGVLWGLIACHNELPRTITFDVRTACRSLVGSLGRWIKAKDEAQGYREKLRLRAAADSLLTLLKRDGSLEQALAGHLDDIRHLMGADGVAFLKGPEVVARGECPSTDEIRQFAAWLTDNASDLVFTSDFLSRCYPPAAAFQKLASGAVAVDLTAGDVGWLIWFKHEQVHSITWAGNPDKAVGVDGLQPVSPRISFRDWSETVRGRVVAWTVAELRVVAKLRDEMLALQQVWRLAELNRQLTTLLKEKNALLTQKEFLITEVNHRTQNSLQLVSSFLSAQSRASDSAETQAALDEARRRLSAVALVHRRLYRGGQIDVVDAARYIEELCTETLDFMGHDWKDHLSLTLSPMQLSTDQAIPLGLVLTELLINANKYAYGGEAGPVEVALTEDRRELRLVVADRGKGSKSNLGGFGSRIMTGLIKQLGGTLGFVDNRPGFRAEITVPIREAMSRL